MAGVPCSFLTRKCSFRVKKEHGTPPAASHEQNYDQGGHKQNCCQEPPTSRIAACVLCRAMACYGVRAMSCYVVLLHACYAVLCRAMSRFGIPRFIGRARPHKPCKSFGRAARHSTGRPSEFAGFLDHARPKKSCKLFGHAARHSKDRPS